MHDFEKRYKALKRRLKKISDERIRLTTQRDDARNNLERLMQECHDSGLEFEGSGELVSVLEKRKVQLQEAVKTKVKEMEGLLDGLEYR